MKFWLACGAASIMAVSALLVYLVTNRWENGRYSLKNNRNMFFFFVIIAWAAILFLFEYVIFPK